MSFHFVYTPLKGLPVGAVVEGYVIVQGTEKSYSGKNAYGYALGDPKRRVELLIYSESPPILEVRTTQK